MEEKLKLWCPNCNDVHEAVVNEIDTKGKLILFKFLCLKCEEMQEAEYTPK